DRAANAGAVRDAAPPGSGTAAADRNGNPSGDAGQGDGNGGKDDDGGDDDKGKGDKGKGDKDD
ncbi:MAG: hypothetical protein M3235_13830, partial [Actinomycetota bacterium]|nr:hypothetical protein [Actinomycetota bacterium]